MKIETLKALGDNYIYIIINNNSECFIIDPSASNPVIKYLESNGLVLNSLLITHSHYDHTGGNKELKKITGCDILSCDERAPGLDRVLYDGEELDICDINIRVILTPGHTAKSACFLCSDPDGTTALFTGDTLFTGGCGRIFDGTYNEMWDSLLKIKALPENSLIYCGHDYAFENYKFAISVWAENGEFTKRLHEIEKLYNESSLTIPSSLKQEKESNIFLLSDNSELQDKIGIGNPADTFRYLRTKKNSF